MAEIIGMSGSSSTALRPIQRSLDIIDISSSDDDFLLDGLGDKMTTNEQDSIVHDVYSRYLAQVLEIIPNVKSEHALGLVQSHYKQCRDSVVERVLHALFEDDSYPKIETKKAKRKREDEGVGGQNKVLKLDYGNKDRPKAVGSNYTPLAFVQLCQDFPYIPVAYIRSQFRLHNALYAPTYLFLSAEKECGKPLPYRTKTTPFRTGVKGKGIEKQDNDFQEERAWLLLKLQEDLEGDADIAVQLNQKGYQDCEDGIECGCCFTTNPFDKMVQCPDTHLFCIDCMTTYASNLLGSHNHNFVCMDQSGCKLLFTHSELRRFLPPKLLDLYERIKQTKEIQMAGLENLEECPHCEFKIVIDNPYERLFRCQNRHCEAVTCRKCKRPDHIPKSCEEMDKDKKLDARHVIEEAMTKALMRNCPKCQRAFVKEIGCNKMSCPYCQTLSCYVCRKIISGYDHFQTGPQGKRNSSACSLWDPLVEQRHSDEVTAAAKKAIEDFKRNHPDVDENDLQIDLPKAPVAGPSNPIPHRHGHQQQPQRVPQPIRQVAPLPPVPHDPNLHVNGTIQPFAHVVVQPQLPLLYGAQIPPVHRPQLPPAYLPRGRRRY